MIDTDRFSGAPWMAVTDADLAPAAHVPTMLTGAERRLYFWLARDVADPGGAIVDLGAFVGGSTARLAAGRNAGGGRQPIHLYDRFTAKPETKANVLYAHGIAPFDGSDILPLARRLLAPIAPDATFHKGEIETLAWDGAPIGLLTLDASKTTAAMDGQAAMFFPHLIPGRSLVVQQDYLHFRQPWVPVQMARLADYFVPVAHCPSDTVVFACTRAPSAEALAAAAVDGMTDAELIEGLRQARDQVAGLVDGAAIRAQIQAVRQNPGVRISWKMRRRPAAG